MTREERKQLIGEAIGEASMCWCETPTGVFDSTRASKIVDRVVAALEKEREGEGVREQDWIKWTGEENLVPYRLYLLQTEDTEELNGMPSAVVVGYPKESSNGWGWIHPGANVKGKVLFFKMLPEDINPPLWPGLHGKTLAHPTPTKPTEQGGFRHVDSIFVPDLPSLVIGLEKVRKNLCCYFGPICDCKYGANDMGKGGEQTGCPEIRAAIAIIKDVIRIPTPDKAVEPLPTGISGLGGISCPHCFKPVLNDVEKEPLAMLADRKGYWIDTNQHRLMSIRIRLFKYQQTTGIHDCQIKEPKEFTGKTYALAEAKARAYLEALPDKEVR